jgi:hypothetical protein
MTPLARIRPEDVQLADQLDTVGMPAVVEFRAHKRRFAFVVMLVCFGLLVLAAVAVGVGK